MPEKITDLSFLLNFTGNSNEKAKKYISMFLERAPQQLKAINQSLTNADYDSLRTTAHSLKPQITYMGIKSLESTIREIEESAGSKTNLEQLPTLVNKLNAELEQSFVELNEFVNNQ